ncbi:MAG: hypothetical protein A2V88_08475, partial [Elusimicrobia bacterium RBG_16_66_12]
MFLTCPYCGSAVFLDTSKVVFHWALTPTLDEPEAGAALSRWMAGNETVKDLDRKAERASSSFSYFPLWLLKIKDGGGHRIHLEPAAATSITALRDLALPPGDLVRYDPALESASVAPSVPLETLLRWQAQLGAGPDQIAEAALVHIPLYTFKYRYQGQSYTAVVEAASGRVLANLFPAKEEAPYRTVALATALTFVCLASVPVAGLIAGTPDGLSVGTAVCIAGGLVAAPAAFIAAAWVA